MRGAAESQGGHSGRQFLDGRLVQLVYARLLDVGLRAGQRSHAVPPEQRARTSFHLLLANSSGI